MSSTRIETVRWLMVVEDVSKALKQDLSTTLEDETRLLLKQVQRFTPPTTGTGRSAATTADREVGEKAIERDLKYLFPGAEGGYLRFVAENFGTSQIRAPLTNKKGEIYLIDWDYIDPDGSDMKGFHRQNQDSRGRVRNATSKRQSKDIGRWVARNKMVVPFEKLTSYIEKTKERVGRMKAAWGAAYIAIGGKLPKWVTRHLSGAKGHVQNNLKSNPPSITVVNFARGVGQINHQVVSALRVRQEAIGKRLKLVLSGYSKDVSKGIRVQNKARIEHAGD